MLPSCSTAGGVHRDVRVGARVSYTSPLSAQVELLVMKALSVGLVKGSIDEVDKRVHMTWVQPRVLDLQQVKMCLKYRVHLSGCLGLYLCCLSFIWMGAIWE